MFKKTRGYLQNKWGSVTTDDLVRGLQDRVDSVSPAFEQWADAATALKGEVSAVSDRPGFSYDAQKAGELADDLRSLLTHKGTWFNLGYKREAILFPKGVQAPEVSLESLEQIAEGLEMAGVRVGLAGNPDPQVKALSRARQSFSGVLDQFRSVVESGREALALPAISGVPEGDSKGAHTRDFMIRDLRYTLNAHTQLISRMEHQAGAKSAQPEVALEGASPS